MCMRMHESLTCEFIRRHVLSLVIATKEQLARSRSEIQANNLHSALLEKVPKGIVQVMLDKLSQHTDVC